MSGLTVTFDAPGGAVPGYLVRPPVGRGPGVVVIQEWWGLVDHIRDICERLADQGFVALAPDLYHGRRSTSPDEARKQMMALDIDRAAGEIASAARFLLEEPAVHPARVAALGFCMGGQLALHASIVAPDVISAAVDFYGVHPAVTLHPERATRPICFHFARQDRSVPLAQAEALVERLERAGVPVEAYFYDAQHAFFNDTRPAVHDAAAAALAWERTLSFLQRQL